MGAVVALPTVLNFLGLASTLDVLLRLARWPVLLLLIGLVLSSLSLRSQPYETEVAVGDVGQRLRLDRLGHIVRAILMVRRQFRKL